MALPERCINNVPPSAACGLIKGFAPRFVLDLATTFAGVIGSKSPCGIKNSAPVVKICKSLPERKPVTVLTLSVDNVILIASSSNPSAALKLKSHQPLNQIKMKAKMHYHQNINVLHGT